MIRDEMLSKSQRVAQGTLQMGTGLAFFNGAILISSTAAGIVGGFGLVAVAIGGASYIRHQNSRVSEAENDAVTAVLLSGIENNEIMRLGGMYQDNPWGKAYLKILELGVRTKLKTENQTDTSSLWGKLKSEVVDAPVDEEELKVKMEEAIKIANSKADEQIRIVGEIYRKAYNKSLEQHGKKVKTQEPKNDYVFIKAQEKAIEAAQKSEIPTHLQKEKNVEQKLKISLKIRMYNYKKVFDKTVKALNKFPQTAMEIQNSSEERMLSSKKTTPEKSPRTSEENAPVSKANVTRRKRRKKKHSTRGPDSRSPSRSKSPVEQFPATSTPPRGRRVEQANQRQSISPTR